MTQEIFNENDLNENTSDEIKSPQEMNSETENIPSKNNGEKNAHYVLKLSFNEIRGEFNGAMVLMGDTQENIFSSVDVVMDKMFSLSLDSDWNTYLDFIRKKKKEVQESGSNFLIFIRKIESYFKKSISNAKIDKINKIIITTEDDMLRNVLIKNILESELSSLIAHGFEVEIILKDEIKYYFKEISEVNSSENPENPINESSNSKTDIILDAIPMIDPNEGIKACEINEGDRIFVRITDDSTVGKHIARSITKNDNPEEMPVRTPVFSAKKNIISKFRASSEVMEIMVKLDDGVFGKIVVQTEVRLRTKLEDEKEPKNITDANQTEYIEAENSGFMPYIFLIGIVFMILYGIIKFLGN